MPLPDFAVNNLLPPGVHPATEAEVRERCVDPFPTSTTRSPMFDDLCHYRRDVESFGLNITQWIDGSFTDRTRLDPQDIDLVNFARYNELYSVDPALHPALGDLLAGDPGGCRYTCNTFLVIVYPLGHKDERKFEEMRRYWRRWFAIPQDYSDPAKKLEAPERGSKGIIEMKIGDATRAPTIDSRQ